MKPTGPFDLPSGGDRLVGLGQGATQECQDRVPVPLPSGILSECFSLLHEMLGRFHPAKGDMLCGTASVH
jgi:hypothetical protein